MKSMTLLLLGLGLTTVAIDVTAIAAGRPLEPFAVLVNDIAFVALVGARHFMEQRLGAKHG